VNGRLLVVAAVVCTAGVVVGVVTTAAVVGPSDVEETDGMVRQEVPDAGSIDPDCAQSAPATLGTMAKEATAKLEPMINRLAHIINAFL
jgi:hypothetical protein